MFIEQTPMKKPVYLDYNTTTPIDTEVAFVAKAMNIYLATAASIVCISTGKFPTNEEVNFAVKANSDTAQKLSKT